MDIALITGAASGVGLAIARKLVETGYRVYGLGGNYADTQFKHRDFIPVPCDLSSSADLEREVSAILSREGGVSLLVNNAKRYLQKPLEACTAAEIDSVLKINLHCPLHLVRLTLPSLRRLQGNVINITVNCASNSRGGTVGAAANGGLRWMSEVLFESERDNGVKVTSIFPQTNPPPAEARGVPFGHSSQTLIDPEIVAAAVASIVNERSGNIVTELVIRPRRTVEKPIPPPATIPYPRLSEVAPETAPIGPENASYLVQASDELRRLEEEDEEKIIQKIKLRREQREERKQARRKETPVVADESQVEGPEECGDPSEEAEERAPSLGSEADDSDEDLFRDRGSAEEAMESSPETGEAKKSRRRRRSRRKGPRPASAEAVSGTGEPPLAESEAPSPPPPEELPEAIAGEPEPTQAGSPEGDEEPAEELGAAPSAAEAVASEVAAEPSPDPSPPARKRPRKKTRPPVSSKSALPKEETEVGPAEAPPGEPTPSPGVDDSGSTDPSASEPDLVESPARGAAEGEAVAGKDPAPAVKAAPGRPPPRKRRNR